MVDVLKDFKMKKGGVGHGMKLDKAGVDASLEKSINTPSLLKEKKSKKSPVEDKLKRILG